MPAIFTNWTALTHRVIDRRIILSENSPPGTYLGSSIAVAPIGMEKSREERLKLLVTEDGVSAGETQQDTQSWPEF